MPTVLPAGNASNRRVWFSTVWTPLANRVGRALNEIRRLLIVAEWYPRDDEPVAGAFIEEQAVALGQRYAVAVIAPRVLRWRERGSTVPGVRVEERRGVVVARVDAVPRVPYLRRAVYDAHLRAVDRAYHACVGRLGGRPDVIHAHVVRYSGCSAVRVGRDHRIPVVLTEHSGPFSVHVTDRGDRRRVVETLAACDAVLAVSPYLRDQMTPYSDRGIDVVGNVLDTEFFSPSSGTLEGAEPAARRLRILAVGLLTPDKRFDLIIDAVAALEERAAPRAELLILGDGPERSALERRVHERGINSLVRFAGSVDRTSVRDAMRQADVLVVASEAETFGMVAAEAMACGTAVIATKSGGPEYVVEPGTGILVPRGDWAAIAEALTRLSADWWLVDREAARRSIERRFGRSAFLDTMAAVYSRVVASQ